MCVRERKNDRQTRSKVGYKERETERDRDK